MIFFPVTQNSQTGLFNFIQRCRDGNGEIDSVILKKIQLCDYEILLITKDQLDLELASRTSISKDILKLISEAWSKIDGFGANDIGEDYPWSVITRIGKGVPMFRGARSRILWSFSGHPRKNVFFIFLTGEEPLGLPIFELMMLSNLWQLDQGYLSVHASCVLHNNYLYLFGGPSGAGKSTISMISQQVGDEILDEDQVLMHLNSNSAFTADGWGSGVVQCEKPIRAIFQIVQDNKDRLLPLTQLQTARFILARNSESLGGGIHDNLLQAFKMSSDIARRVPGFKLHFRKSPDFWKLIDEQFPD